MEDAILRPSVKVINSQIEKHLVSLSLKTFLMSFSLISSLCAICNSIKPHQDRGWVIMKGCVNWSPVYDGKDFRLQQGLELGTGRSAGQRLTYTATMDSGT